MKCKSALQRELDRFYKEISGGDYSIREVTKGALTQSRAKLNPWAFQRLNELVCEVFYRDAPYDIWRQKRVVAADGSTLMLPNHPSIKEEFGEHGFGPNADSNRSLACCSLLYDVLNQITLDAQLAPFCTDERDLLVQHLEHLTPDDLLLLDRGYACFWLIFLLKAKGIDFCVRLKESGWRICEEFLQSGRSQQEVCFELPPKDHDKLRDYPHMFGQKITCRLVRVDLDNGEPEVLCTSLLDPKSYPCQEFKELYHLRWNEEEAFKVLKSRAELEDFSGKTARAVRQDFFAKVFMMSLCAAFSHPIAEKVRSEYQQAGVEEKKLAINRTHALATLGDMLVPLFLKQKFEQGLKAFDQLVSNTLEMVRPGRSHPRRKRPKKLFHMNYKRL